jgi:hypothetical protein
MTPATLFVVHLLVNSGGVLRFVGNKKGGQRDMLIQAVEITVPSWCNKKGGQCQPSARLPILFIDNVPTDVSCHPFYRPLSKLRLNAGFPLWCNKKGGQRDMLIQAMASQYLCGATKRVGSENLECDAGLLSIDDCPSDDSAHPFYLPPF